jgi:hypothetical protein
MKKEEPSPSEVKKIPEVFPGFSIVYAIINVFHRRLF